jgi:hypothetical protein
MHSVASCAEAEGQALDFSRGSHARTTTYPAPERRELLPDAEAEAGVGFGGRIEIYAGVLRADIDVAERRL